MVVARSSHLAYFVARRPSSRCSTLYGKGPELCPHWCGFCGPLATQHSCRTCRLLRHGHAPIAGQGRHTCVRHYWGALRICFPSCRHGVCLIKRRSHTHPLQAFLIQYSSILLLWSLRLSIHHRYFQSISQRSACGFPCHSVDRSLISATFELTSVARRSSCVAFGLTGCCLATLRPLHVFFRFLALSLPWRPHHAGMARRLLE